MTPLFIPYVNRMDLLEKAILSAHCKGVEINILDNSDGPSLGGGIVYRRPTVPLTFAQTQNWMLKIAEADSDYDSFYLFMHSDAEAVGDTVLRLVAMAKALTTQNRRWGAIFTAYDALAAFSTEAMTAIGGWDPLFPWYFADNITYRKLHLAGYELIESNLPVKHEPSQTLKSDPSLAFRNSLTFPFYADLYRKMWGGLPGSELFSQPFQGVLS